ncbi:hypothetical protein NECAME_11958 [Necator americanus]|uniref:Uncharacterized protein n=1 Tax=Necator americanus TaxID=51031 RepID=W2T518_NECAM|nr:hypothetical protein NECAME_11958 [Necator americanus]ETN76067.1 hypothetical protein NECAME_11958 [Necator americanus]
MQDKSTLDPGNGVPEKDSETWRKHVKDATTPDKYALNQSNFKEIPSTIQQLILDINEQIVIAVSR